MINEQSHNSADTHHFPPTTSRILWPNQFTDVPGQWEPCSCACPVECLCQFTSKC